MLNSRGLAAIGAPESIDGRLYGADDVLRDRIDGVPLDLPGTCAELAAFGVTGVTDLSPTERTEDVKLLTSGTLPLRIRITGGPGLEDWPALTRVAVKLLLADHTLPSLAELVAAIRDAHTRNHRAAVHSVTIESLLLVLAAWADAGTHPGDRLGTMALSVPPAQQRELGRLGITVVTQPNFIAERDEADDERRDEDRADRFGHGGDVRLVERPRQRARSPPGSRPSAA